MTLHPAHFAFDARRRRAGRWTNMKLKARRTRCPTCGGWMTERTYGHIEKVGRHPVKVPGAILPVCGKCGEVEMTLDELAGYQQRAAAIVLREAKPIDGAVIRYARKALGLKQTKLAELLAVRNETISRWEKDREEMPRTAQLALVAILDGVDRLDGNVEAYVRNARANAKHPPRHLEVVPHPLRRTADGR
jgi:putative zinc finger/helix-turn-helix YgiT family protein